jgi:hypothetical protein
MSPPAICCGITKFRQHAAREPADAEFQALEVVDGLDLLAKPAAHLAGGVAGKQRGDVVLLVEIVQHRHAAGVHPGLIHSLIGPEGDRRSETERRVFAKVIIGGGVAALDGSI